MDNSNIKSNWVIFLLLKLNSTKLWLEKFNILNIFYDYLKYTTNFNKINTDFY